MLRQELNGVRLTREERRIESSETPAPPGDPTEFLLCLVSRARTWRERIASSALANGDEALMDRWRELASGGQFELFEKRLRWDGLDREAAQRAIGSGGESCALPDWAVLLARIINLAASPAARLIPAGGDGPLPFIELLLPALAVARLELAARLAAPVCSDGTLRGLPELDREAFGGIERDLLERLAAIAGRPLEQMFNRTKPIGDCLLARLLGDVAEPAPGRERYDAFIARCLDDGLRGVFWEFPVLARLIARLVDDWVEASTNLIGALRADLPELRRLFGDPPRHDASATDAVAEDWTVVAIESGLSDPHSGGQTVKVLTFSSGRRLVYKPRSLGLDLWFQSLVAWCNEAWEGPPLRSLKVLDRGAHGWVEFAEPCPCTHESEVERFFERAGALLCLVYLSGGNDTHYENLLAAGEHPLLIDLETLLQPLPKEFEEGLVAARTALDAFDDSALRTGLLPRWRIVTHPSGTTAMDDSGLGSGGGLRVPYICWRAVGTDDIHWVHEGRAPKVQRNLPVIYGKRAASEQYVSELTRGFRAMYRLIVDRRALLKETQLPGCRGLPVRFIFRGTSVYFMLLRGALAPEYLTSGARFSIELDALSSAFLFAKDRPVSWAIVEAEERALEQLDIPCFRGVTDELDVAYGAPSRLKGCFSQSGYQRLLERLERLGEKDLNLELAIIRGSFVASESRTTGGDEALAESCATSEEYEAALSPNDFLDEARKIGERLIEVAIPSSDGSLSWLGLQYLPLAGRLQLQTVGGNLYDGNGGIALFLAALGGATGSQSFGDAARRALLPLATLLKNPGADEAWARDLGIGGAVGLGSYVYCLTRVALWLGDESLMDASKNALGLLTAERIERDERLDVVLGAAGATLALLAMHRLTGEQRCFELAKVCGDHLLARRGTSDDCRAWRTLEEWPISGFSHGSAGIAYALLRLFESSGDLRYRRAAEEAIDYETRCLVPETHNWSRRSVAPDREPLFGRSWCHGAPGIGLARLGSLAVLRSNEINRDIEATIVHLREPPSQIDHPCCGNAGRIEAMLVAAHRLNRPDLLALALNRGSWMVRRARRTGGFSLGRRESSFWRPTFFQGAAGIGYELLRLCRSELPSVLLWD